MGRLAVPSTSDTRSREVESRLRELDRKSATSATNVESLIAAGRHHWHGNGLVDAGGITQDLTTWAVDVTDNIAKLTGGALVLNQAGRWSLLFQYRSDATEAGLSACWLESLTAPLAPWGPFQAQLRDDRYRHAGFAQAGFLSQSVRFDGVVTADQAASPIRPRVMWRSGGTGVQATAEWVLIAHYLGAARLPTA